MAEELSMTLKKWVELTLHKSFSGIVKFSKENNLTITLLGTLIRLYHKGNCTISEIGTEMGISNAAASQLLDRMVQLGFIERSVDNNDRRIKNVNLTQNGIKIVSESFRASKKWFEDLVNQIKNDEQEEIITVLNSLIKYVNLFNGNSDLDK